MKDNSACFSSNSVHWSTPNDLYNAFMIKGYLDPCPLHCTYDGLAVEYFNKKLFINPPFEDLPKWCEFIKRQVFNGCTVVLLMPSRTDTNYFHELLKLKPSIFLIKGRLKFGNSDKVAPFPTILLKFYPNMSFNWYDAGTVEDYIKYYV